MIDQLCPCKVGKYSNRGTLGFWTSLRSFAITFLAFCLAIQPLPLFADLPIAEQSPTGYTPVRTVSPSANSPATTTSETAHIITDQNQDSQVNLADFVIQFNALKNEFGRRGSDLQCDYDGNGRVDLSDFALLKAALQNLNTTTNPSSDTTPPQIEILSSALTNNPQNYTLVIRVDGQAEVISGDQLRALLVHPTGSVSQSTSTQNFQEGENILELRRTDEAGNTATERFILTVDTRPPAIQIATLIPQATRETSFTVAYSVDGVSKSRTFNLHEGLNNLSIQETDLAGNRAYHNFSISRDTIGPSIQLLSSNSTTDPENYVLQINVDGQIEEISGQALRELRTPAGSLTEGQNQFSLTRSDSLGNVTTFHFTLSVSAANQMPNPDSNYIPVVNGEVTAMPDDTALTRFVDPFAGESFRVEQFRDNAGTLLWTKEFYSSGQLRSIQYHTGTANGGIQTYYPSGNVMSYYYPVSVNTPAALTHYYSDELVPGTTRGVLLQSTYADGREYRFIYFSGTEQRKFYEEYRSGIRQYRYEYMANGNYKAYWNYEDGSRWMNYDSGVRQLYYHTSNHRYQEYYDEPFTVTSWGQTFGRLKMRYDTETGTNEYYREYWQDTDHKKVVEVWENGVLNLTKHYFENGSTLRYQILPDWRRQSPYPVDAHGLPIMPPSDQRLNSLILTTSDQIARAEDIYANYVGFIKNSVDGLDGDKWAQEEARYIETIQNLRQNHPELVLGSYISLQFGTNDPSKLVNFPPNQFIRAWAYEEHGGIRLTDADLIDYTGGSHPWHDSMGHDWGFDLSKDHVRRWLAAFHIDKAIEYKERYGIAVYHVDNFGIHYYGTNPVTGDQYAVEVGRMIKAGLNANGILFEANVGGDSMVNDYENFRFLMADGQRVNTMTDLQEDIASAVDIRSIEGPYWMEHRNVEQTTNFFENARNFLDQGKTLLLLSASYYGKNVQEHDVANISNATMETPNGTRTGLILETSEIHHIFPMAGSGIISLQDLPDGYDSWENNWYIPMEIPGQPNKVFLYQPWSNVPTINGTLTNVGRIFNRSEDERVNAALAMLIREPGDHIYVTSGLNGDATTSSTSLDHDPSNWKTWPMQFGQALGGYEITEHRVENFTYCNDIHAQDCETRSDDRVISIRREFENCTFIFHPQTTEVEILWKN